MPTGQVVPLARSDRTRLAGAVAAFLAQPSLAAATRRSYAQTLGRLQRELGATAPLAELTVEAVSDAVTTAWGTCTPATWNCHVATIRSFVVWGRRRRWLAADADADLAADLERRPEPADRTKAIPIAKLERLWKRDDVAVREKALWRFLYKTAARATRGALEQRRRRRPGQQAGPGPLQGRRHRLAALPDRLG